MCMGHIRKRPTPFSGHSDSEVFRNCKSSNIDRGIDRPSPLTTRTTHTLNAHSECANLRCIIMELSDWCDLCWSVSLLSLYLTLPTIWPNRFVGKNAWFCIRIIHSCSVHCVQMANSVGFLAQRCVRFTQSRRRVNDGRSYWINWIIMRNLCCYANTPFVTCYKRYPIIHSGMAYSNYIYI